MATTMSAETGRRSDQAPGATTADQPIAQADLASHRGHRFIVEAALVVTLVLLLIVITAQIMLPFVGILAYAVILSTALWVPTERLARKMGGRRSLAAALLTIVLLVVVVTPLVYLGSALSGAPEVVTRAFDKVSDAGLPQWLTGLPWIGSEIDRAWQRISGDVPAAIKEFRAQIQAAVSWFISRTAGLAFAAVELVIGVIAAGVILGIGPVVHKRLLAIATRLSGDRGPVILEAAARAIRGVAVGIIGTALLQGVLAWFAFSVAGVPAAVVIAAVLFFLAALQVGPLLICLPLAIWLAYEGRTGDAIFIGIWFLVVLMPIDNFAKPWLMARFGSLPLSLLFIGLIGGLAAWGFTGMFIGVTVLAVAWTILNAWIAQAPADGRTD